MFRVYLFTITIRYPHREIQRGVQERIHEQVNYEIMRLLDLHDRQRGEGRGQERGLSVVEARDNEIQDQDREQVCQRGELAAKIFHRPRLIAERLVGDAHQGQRQVAIHVESRAAIIGVERGRGGIEIFEGIHPALALGRAGVNRHACVHADVGAQSLGHAGDEQLVGMLVLALAPVHAGDAQNRRQRKHGDEENVINPGVFFWLHVW